MNVVIATSPASAPSAGVIPGTAAGATPGAGPSFADVLQQLAGGTAPAAVAGDGSSRAAGAGAATGRTSDADESGDDVAGAPTDFTTVMGAMTVPVALVVPPVTELPPADVAGDLPAATDDPTPITRASSGPSPALGPRSNAAVGSAPGGPPARAAGSTAGRDTACAVADSTATSADGTAGPVPVEHLVGAPVATDRASERVDRGTRDRTSALGHASPGAARRTWSEPARSSVDWSNLDRPAQPAPTASTTVAPAAPTTDGALAAETPAGATSQAAAIVARLMTEPRRDLGRALGLPRALARVLDGGPAAGSASAAPAEIAGAVAASVAAATGAAALPTDLEGLVAGVTEPVAPAVPAGAAAARGQHPGLSAALRAFQQAGAPAPAGGPSEAAAQSVVESANVPATASRCAAFAGGEAEAVTPGADAGHRSVSVPSVPATIAPSLGGDLRIGASLSASARLEAARVATFTLADGDDLRAQIVQSIRVQWTGGAGEARVRLRPEHLGEVVATIKVEHGAVTATLQAERPEVRRWLEAHAQTLREGLVDHGLKLDRLIVLTEPARGETRDDTQGRARGRPSQHPQQRPRRPRPDDSGATFDLNP